MRIILAYILAILMIVLSIQTDVIYTSVKAVDNSVTIWDGLNSAAGEGKFTLGDGTAENPYVIRSGDQLYKMVYDMGKTGGVVSHYKLECDIYLNDISNYSEWGKSNFDMSSLNNWSKYEDSFCHRTFAGNFDGNGYTIYGLYANSYRVASFFPNVAFGAVVRNVNFKNSYIVNTSQINANDQEDAGNSVGEIIWYAGVYASAGVMFSRCDAAGDSDSSTADFTINNCTVTDAYVQAKYFTSAFVAVANSCQPYIANCMTANITLNSTSDTMGVEGAILNMPYGSTNPTVTIENVLAVGYQIYGAGRDEMWSGKKTPAVSHTYTFKNVYSTVSNKYTINHSSYGSLSFTDSEVNVVDATKLIGAEAEKTIPTFDWAYIWRAVEGDYPRPLREYIVPTGDEYYKNGGPKYATDMWDGTVANHFAAGNGTVEDPYLIANCEEFYRMAKMPENDKYYKIATGVTDLYFNDIEGKSYSTLMTYFSWGISCKTFATDESVCFNGSFDGNGVTMHGFRVANNNYAGIFSQVGTATLSNFTVSYSYFKTSSSAAKGAAVIVGNVKDDGIVHLKNIAVIDCTVSGKNSAAGFVGNGGNGSDIYITNTIVSNANISASGSSTYNAAFLANATSCDAVIQNSISLGIYPASNATASCVAEYSAVYTDTAAPSGVTAIGINTVDKNALQGEQAKLTCKEFNWNYSWSVTDDIPMPKNQQNNNGVVGAPWSGEVAMSFAGGNGSKTDPYQINTAEMLARMLTFDSADTYYKLTADIILNDTTSQDWQNTAIKWFTSKNVSAFEGSIDGNGFKIYGLYANASLQDEYAALIPVLGTASQIKKIKLDDSYLIGAAGTYLGGIAGVLEDNSAVATYFNACIVGSNVSFNGDASVGGIIADVGYSRAKIENCVFKGNINTSGDAFGICLNVIGNLHIYECISLNAVPFDANEKIDARNVYTNMQSGAQGVITLETSKMIGIGARNNMTALDFSSPWKLETNDVPTPTGNVKAYNGVKGEIWSGKTATSFAKGTGLATNPYIIETAEQLALMLVKANSYENKYFKLACDIYLNDVNCELWQDKIGGFNWINSRDTGYFKGHLDGNGYVVFGMFNSFKSTPNSTYFGLIPYLAGSASVKNLGVSEAYIKVSTEKSGVYAGGIFGMGSAFYDFYGNKTGVNDTEGDEFLIPGQTTPTKLPSITNCFVDHTSYIEASSVGGIGCAGGAAIVIRDCYVTATLIGEKDTKEGSLLGPNWANCSRVYNSFAFTQSDNKVIGGNQQWIETQSGICTYTENVYYHGTKPIFGTTRIKRPQWRIGEEAKANMPELDWENNWRVETDGTPVLCVFDKDERSAAQFSDKNFVIPEVKVTLESGIDGVEDEVIIGKAYEKIELPTPKRQGYKFVAWHAYDDLTCEYKYDFFLPRDITLYAEWKEISITQDFENYPYTQWDCDKQIWRYNTPDNAVEYDSDLVRSGEKSMQIMTADDVATLLVNYKQTLTAAQQYTISFWAAGSNDDGVQFALAHKMYPDYMAADKLIEPISPAETLGKWTRYELSFESQTPWIAIKVLNGQGVYIDDIVIDITGDLLAQTEVLTDVYEGEFYSSTLESVVLTDGVTKIGEFGFAYSDMISDIYISDSVTQIDEYAFYGCKKLTDVWYAGSENDFREIVISKNNYLLKDANWHFDSCALGLTHSYSEENEYVCNQCGKLKSTAIIGDANEDGKLNFRDCAIMMQYINGWDVEVNTFLADVNGDNKVNNRDYVILVRYLNGWDVSLKY